MSDSNRVSLGVVLEVTPGTTPPTPEWEALRITGAPSLGFIPTTVQTDEIRADRNITDLILTDAEAGGEISMELSHGAQDTFLEAVMFNTWTERNNRKNGDVTSISSNVITVVSGDAWAVDDLVYLEGFGDANDEVVFEAIATSDATTITAASGLTDNGSAPVTARIWNVGVKGATGDIDSTVSPDTLTSTILDFTTLGLLVGDWMKIGGTNVTNQLPTAVNNDWCRISGIAAAVLTFDIVPAGWSADASTTEDVYLFFGDRIRNGITKLSYSLEEVFNDHVSPTFQYFTGIHVDSMTITLPSAGIITASINTQGFSSSATTTRFAGSTDKVAQQNTIYNTSSNIGRIGRGTDGPFTTINGCVQDAAITIGNNLRRLKCIGTLGAIGMGAGQFVVTGNTNAFFEDLGYLNDVINNTERSLDIRMTDALNKVLLFDSPRLKYTDGSPGVAGPNQDVLIPLGFQSILESANDLYTLQIQRFHKIQV